MHSLLSSQTSSVNLNIHSFTKSQKKVLLEVLHHLNYETGELYITRKGLAEKLGLSRKTIHTAYKFFHELKILASERQSRGVNGIWGYCRDVLNIKDSTVCNFITHTFPTGINKNKKNILNASEDKKVWIEPTHLTIDFDFSLEEKELTKERHEVSDLDVEEAIMDWKSYNLHRKGFNWFSSFERFCLAREWPRRIERKRTFANVHVNTQPKNNYKAFSNAPCRVGEVVQKHPKPTFLKNIIKKAVKVAWHKPKPKKLPALPIEERERLFSEMMGWSCYSNLKYRDRTKLINYEIDRSYDV